MTGYEQTFAQDYVYRQLGVFDIDGRHIRTYVLDACHIKGYSYHMNEIDAYMEEGSNTVELRIMDIHERMKHYKVPGISLALIKNGEISSTEAYGVVETETNIRVNHNSIFNACSISKFVSTILVLKLTEQGVLDLDEDVNNKLIAWKVPENEFTLNNKVTLRTLLSHQSGIVDPKGSFGELDSSQGIPTMVDLLNGTTAYCSEPY